MTETSKSSEEKLREKPGDDEVTKDADKKSTEGLDYCIQPGNPEAVRPNEEADDACDPGRTGTFEEKK